MEITPIMLKAAWVEARRWWPKKTVEYHDCKSCRQTKGIRVVETSILVDTPQPGFKEAMQAMLKASGR